MIQIRAGDLLKVRFDEHEVVFAVLTKKVLFGGNWCYVFYGAPSSPVPESPGFNAFVDFLVPKRQGRVDRLSSHNKFQGLEGPELLKQQPTRGESKYVIYRWSNMLVGSVQHLRTTPSPTTSELAAPEYSCLPADFACELALRKWRPQDRMWSA